MKKNTLKTVVLAGLGGKPNDRDYRRFKGALVFSPKWEYGSLKSYKREFHLFLKKHKLEDGKYNAVGFSLGAYVLACSDVRPSKTVYASLSPLFPKYLRYWPTKWKAHLGKRRFSDLGTFVPKPNSTFLVGDQEPHFFHKASFELSKLSADSKFNLLKDTGHNLFEEYYFKHVQSLLK